MNSAMQIMVGGILALVSSGLILYVSIQGKPVIPGLLGSAAALVLALGVLLVGISGSDGRPV